MNADNRFLACVAQYYFNNPASGRTCLLFPNKRSAIFFRQYFKDCAKNNPGKTAIIPTTMTIGAFLEQYSNLEAINSIEALFVLYKTYCDVVNCINDPAMQPTSPDGDVKHKAAEIMRFDSFVFWGRMLLNDFEDVEAADAAGIYKNLADLKEISANYLSEEQLQVLQYVFGERMVEHYRQGDDGEFWRHITYEDGSNNAHTRFVELWMLLGDIYQEYRKRLIEMGRGYPALMARDVFDRLLKTELDIPFERIGFVGFNAPTPIIESIMRVFNNRDCADFFWDVLPDDVMSEPARRRVAKLAGSFKMPDGYTPPEVHRPMVNVMSVPSDYMQAKMAIAQLETLKKNKALNTVYPDNTALVLPDPNLLPDLLQSMPNDFGKLNVTMGLPMRNTFFASMMRNIVNLQVNIDMRDNIPTYRAEDVRAIVSNPRLLAVAHSACRVVLKWLDDKHTYMVSGPELANLDGVDVLLPIFLLYEKSTPASICEYFDNVLKIFENVNAKSAADRHEQMVVSTWRKALNTVVNLIEKYEMPINDKEDRKLIFTLLWRIVSSDEIHVSGTPVTGLQVMGMLETRNLDFDNVIVLSVNENVCPPRHGRRTFIPAMLRRGFGLATDDDYALEYDYYFYRLLSRSNDVTFMYDSRTAMRRNARSHLIDQMIFMRPNDLKMTITPIRAMPGVPQKREFAVEKTDAVMQQVDKLRDYNSGVNLSASAIKIYRKCPMRFYLSTICGVRESDEMEDYMSFSMYGSVVHKVLEDIFIEMRQPGNDRNNPVVVTEAMLNNETDENKLLQRVQKVINKMYHDGHYSEHLDNLPGESRLLAKMITGYVQKVLEKEIKTVQDDGPFKFVDAEEKYKSILNEDSKQRMGEQMNFGKDSSGKDLIVNFSLSIDRHDILADGTHRFIDYKTGKDDNKCKSLAELFDHNSEGNDAALQLLIYAEAYLANHPNFNSKIRPVVYKLREAFTGKMDKDVVEIYNKNGESVDLPNMELIWERNVGWRKIFVDRLNTLVQEIFDPKVPFFQAKDAEKCKYCPFIDMCMRTVSEY